MNESTILSDFSESEGAAIAYCDKRFSYFNSYYKLDNLEWVYDGIHQHESTHHLRAFDTEIGFLKMIFGVFYSITNKEWERRFFEKVLGHLYSHSKLAEESLATFVQNEYTKRKYPNKDLLRFLPIEYQKYCATLHFLNGKNIFGFKKYSYSKKIEYASTITIWSMNNGIINNIISYGSVKGFDYVSYLDNNSPDDRFNLIVKRSFSHKIINGLRKDIESVDFANIVPDFFDLFNDFSHDVARKAQHYKDLQSRPQVGSTSHVDGAYDNFRIRTNNYGVVDVEFESILTCATSGMMAISIKSESELHGLPKGVQLPDFRGYTMIFADPDYLSLEPGCRDDLVNVFADFSMIENLKGKADTRHLLNITNVPIRNLSLLMHEKTILRLDFSFFSAIGFCSKLPEFSSESCFFGGRFTIYQLKAILFRELNSHGKHLFAIITPKNDFSGISYLFIQRQGSMFFIITPFFDEQADLSNPEAIERGTDSRIAVFIKYTIINYRNMIHVDSDYNKHFNNMSLIRKCAQCMHVFKF